METDQSQRGRKSREAWSILCSAAQNKQSLTYSKVGKQCDCDARDVGKQLLEPIQSYCIINKLPPLTVLVVRADTGMPGKGFIAANDIEAARRNVFEHDWNKTQAPSADELLKAVEQRPSCGIRDAAIPDDTSTVKDVAAKWQYRQSAKHPSSQASRVHVEIASGKSHSTIWGKAVKKLDDIRSPDARHVFQTIMAVDGITCIKLGKFGHKEERSSVVAVVQESNQAFIIEGKLFDKGPKGTLQTFQVRVQKAERRNTILLEIIDALKNSGYWAG